jgi:excisionase family DNA binding protein
MATLTMGQAAKLVGLSKSTLSRAVSSGRLSATRTADGSYEIDPSELMRVYNILPEAIEAARNSGQPVPLRRDTTPIETALEYGVASRLAAAEAEIAGLKAMVDELRRARDSWQGQAERLLIRDHSRSDVIVTPPPAGASSASQPAGWWPFRRRA